MMHEIGELKEIMSYDPISGNFYWLVSRFRAKAGALIGYKDTNGYICAKITLHGKRFSYLLHRLAFAFTYGRWPTEIDHINRNRSDNRIGNLREISHRHNLARKYVKHRELPRGVVYVPKINKTNSYMAQCGSKFVGYFGTPKEAHEAYLEAFKLKYGALE